LQVNREKLLDWHRTWVATWLGDQVRGDRAHLVEPRLAGLALDVAYLGVEAAVGRTQLLAQMGTASHAKPS
jgi:hypothetical protein